MSNSSRNALTCAFPAKGRAKFKSWYTTSSSKHASASSLKSLAPCTSSQRYFTTSLAVAGRLRAASGSGAGDSAGGFATALRSAAVKPPGLTSGSAISRAYAIRPDASTSTNVVPRSPISPASFDLCHVNPEAPRPSHRRSTTSRPPPAASRVSRADRCSKTAARPTSASLEWDRSSHRTSSAHAAATSEADHPSASAPEE